MRAMSLPDDCQAIVTARPETLPGLSILVNNAGVYGPMGPIEEIDWDEWVQGARKSICSAPC